MAPTEISERETTELEPALLRDGMDQRAGEQECCSGCRRIPLTGERVYLYERGRVLCELCRVGARQDPIDSRLVHTEAFGQSIRILDQRAA